MKKHLFKTTAIIAIVCSPLYTPVIAGVIDGAALYKSYCGMCHDSGAAGTPKLGDKAAWKSRIAKGNDTLEKHAIEGYKGMPARGGNIALSDEEVKAAVAHMIGAAK